MKLLKIYLILAICIFVGSCSKDDNAIIPVIQTPTPVQPLPNFSSMVTTGIVKNISVEGFTVDVNANVTNSNYSVEKRGICFSTSPNPTISNTDVDNPTAGNGVFSISVETIFPTASQFYVNISPNTTYYLRSYIKIAETNDFYYGNEVTFKTTGYVGGSGGYVFYDKGEITNGWRYLEAAPTNFTTTANTYFYWSNSTCGNSFISGLGNEIGDGLNNTTLIKNFCNYNNVAATMCKSTSLNGHTDWFLPSINELREMYKLKVINLVNINYAVWSSSQSSNTLGLMLDNTNGAITTHSKNDDIHAWQVRRF